MADNSAPSGADRPHAHRPIYDERPPPFTMSEAARALHLGTGRRIIDDLLREQRLAAEAARAMNQETARRAFEDLRRNRRLEDEAAHARRQENARRAVEDLMREHRLRAEAPSALPSPTHTEPAPPGKPKGIPKEETEVRVREWLRCHSKENPRDINRDALAKAIGVGAGSVSKSAAWMTFAERRKAGFKPVPREVPLTDAMLANIPANSDDEELAELIKAQAEDDAADERRPGKKSPRHERRHDPS